MNFEKLEEKGAAPTLAIFLILIVISSALVISQLQSSEEREISAIQLLMASDEARSALSSINSELNGALRKSATAAMYDVGMSGGSIEDVENYVIDYLNNRIEKGWKHPNLEENVPLVDENSISFKWQPDGSLSIKVYLDTKIKHVNGPTAYGTYLEANPYPRFQRIRQVARNVADKIPSDGTENEINELENELNENYECEGLSINLKIDDSTVIVNVEDDYAGERAIIE